MTAFNQTFWAVSDANWGNPIVIPETVRAGQMAAQDAFLDMTKYGMYSGVSMWPMPDGTRGNMEKARAHGFKLVSIKITDANVEVVG